MHQDRITQAVVQRYLRLKCQERLVIRQDPVLRYLQVDRLQDRLAAHGQAPQQSHQVILRLGRHMQGYPEQLLVGQAVYHIL